MPSNNYIYKMSNAGGMSTVTRYTDMLAGNATFVPFTTSAYDSIATTTVGSGGASSITFSSIPQIYTHLQVRAFARCTFTGAVRNILTQMNGDTGSNYYRHYLLGNGTAAFAGSDGGTVIYGGSVTGTDNLGSTFGVNVIDYLDYANTNKYKTVRYLNGHEDNSGGQAYLTSGLWNNTAAITSLTFTIEGSFNFSQYTSFALYGIKAV
jgi:hypothetical protein